MLRNADLRAVLELALEAQGCDSVEELREGLLPSLRRLVPCEIVGYNEIDLARGTALGIFDPADGAFDGIQDAFLAVAHQHPLVRRQQRGDLGARRLSDFLTVRQLHRLELYQDFYKLIDTEAQLAFGLGGEVLVAFALCRSKRDFSERDRELLEALRPHLARAYLRVRRQARTRSLLHALEECAADRGLGLVELDASGRVEHVAAAAAELLDAYLGEAPDSGQALPSALLQQRNNGRQLTIDSARGRLQIHEEQIGGKRMLVLEEQRPCAPRIEALRSLGLTPRQAQVMRLVACGKPSHQVAAELRIELATVEKHLEHIYARLGVSSRAAAIARVYA